MLGISIASRHRKTSNHTTMTAVEGPTMMSHPHKRLSPNSSKPRGLKPYDHQVAGQSLILRYDDTTICKCLFQREYQFYQTVPESLQQFMPQFKGVIQVNLPETSGHDCQPGCTCSRFHHHRPSPTKVPLGWVESNGPSLSLTVSEFSVAPHHMRALRKTSRSGDVTGDSSYYFILLEDLMSKYKHPCVLDLKVGVRQHGDDAPPEKVAHHENLCRRTTSTSLGIRLCGMKRFLATTCEYEKLDKIYGRQLSDDSLKADLVKFLFNGQQLRLDLVDSIVSQLSSLKHELEQLEGYRFYSCSLLIIYEGCTDILGMLESHEQCDSEGYTGFGLKKIEDVHSCADETGNKIIEQGETNVQMDDVSIINSQRLQKKHQLLYGSDNELQLLNSSSSSSFSSSQSFYENSSVQSSTSTSTKNLPRNVDVQIVDFAHATYDGFVGDTVRHCGPDHGFLLGIDTLLEVYSDLQNKDTDWSFHLSSNLNSL